MLYLVHRHATRYMAGEMIRPSANLPYGNYIRLLCQRMTAMMRGILSVPCQASINTSCPSYFDVTTCSLDLYSQIANMASHENKTVIVTGCTSGIGLATTLLFLSRKARVFGIDISPFTHELDAAQSASFAFHQADICAPGASETAVTACQAKIGRQIHVLANVAGVADNYGSVDTLTDAAWDRVIAINLTAPVRLMRAVIPIMREHKSGAIVNVGSLSSKCGATAGVAYTASKHGIAGATKNVAFRFRHEGITCNCVLPGGKEFGP